MHGLSPNKTQPIDLSVFINIVSERDIQRKKQAITTHKSAVSIHKDIQSKKQTITTHKSAVSIHKDIILSLLWSANVEKLNRHTCNLKKTLTSPLLDCSVPCLTYSGVAFVSWLTVLCCHTDMYMIADTVIVSSRDNTRVVPTRRRDELLLPVFFVSTSWNLDTEFYLTRQ